VGSLEELRRGTWDALEGRLRIEATEGSPPDHVEVIDGPVWVGEGCEFGDGVRLMGPVVVGDRCRVGSGASLRESIVFPGTEVSAGAIVIGAIFGTAAVVESMRPFDAVLGTGRPLRG
jgi:NDP-sugar pyrophosphorylase family protein